MNTRHNYFPLEFTETWLRYGATFSSFSWLLFSWLP
jgi:hypothetical protein